MRGILPKPILTTLIFALISSAFASNGRRTESLRIIVQFQRGTALDLRRANYNSVNGKIIETFSSINADLVIIQNGKRPATSSDEEEAHQICGLLLKDKQFVGCEPDRKLKIDNETVTSKRQKSLQDNTALSLVSKFESVHEGKCEVVLTRGLQDPQTGRKPGKDGTWHVSPLWGQHAIGADLAAEFVSSLLQSGKVGRVPIGNIDIIGAQAPSSPIAADAVSMDLLPFQKGESRHHGNQTSDLVDKPPFGVSPVVSWALLANLAIGDRSHEAWNSQLIKSLELASKTKARLVTASVGYFGSTPRQAIDNFVDSGKIFVQASGNDYPVKAWEGNAPHFGHILVGSVGPNGLSTPFSQEPAKIYAPSDGAQLSGPKETFGGTSGAAPLVSGSLSNALASLPGLTNEEAESLLRQTSLPSFGLPNAGIVNAYRLAVVAECLGSEWPKSRVALLKIPNSAFAHCFDQKQFAQSKLESANRMLFGGSGSCEDRRDGLKSLRASFLLDPTSQKARQIARLYKDLGFRGDSRWYETMAAAMGSDSDRRNHFLSLLKEPSLAVHRYFAGSTLEVSSRGAYAMTLASRLQESHEFVKLAQQEIARLANSNRANDRIEAVERAGFLGPYSIPFVFPALQKSDEFSNPRAAGPFFQRLTIADGVPNPWEPMLKAKLKGTEYERFLR